MKKQMKWGLATLILLLGIAAVFIFLDQNAELQQLEQETAESDKLRQEHNKLQETPQVVDVSDDTQRPPPPGETHQTGYWHGDHWHRHDEARTDVVISAPQVTAAQRAEWEKYWKDQGLDPPPDGHGYRYDKDGKVAGLFKYNEPEFEVGWSKSEAPGQDFTKLTETEWIRYHALRHIVGGSLLYLDQPMIKRMMAGETLPKATYARGVQELAEEWMNELRYKASGPTPKVTTSVTWDRDPTPAELEEIARKKHELLESMERPKRLFPEWQPFVETIVQELESELKKRR